MTYNNIYLNNYNIKSGFSNAFNASNNWWGSTDQSVIDKSIYDYNDDFNLGKVNYVPFLTAPNPQAMPDASSDPSTLPSSAPSETPETPEYPTWTIPAVLIIAVLAMALVFKKSKSYPK